MQEAILKGIRVLLKQMPVSVLLDQSNTVILQERMKDIFIREFLAQYKMYSEDEAVRVYNLILGDKTRIQEAVFLRVIEMAEEYLYMNGKELCCYQDKLLEFREITKGIGHSIFVCAFLAVRQYKTGIDYLPIYESPVIRSDDMRLRHILSNGIAENHFHLNGSAPTAILSWVCLMNHPSRREQEFIMFNEQRNFFSFPQEDGKLTLYDEIIWSAAIRLLLFYKNLDRKKDEEKVGDWLRSFHEKVAGVDELQILIDGERGTSSGAEYDYIGSVLDRNDIMFPIAGEWTFLVHIFSMYLEHSSDTDINFMYMYILIYCRFYGELIQSNDAVGFYNFLRYQDRKEIFLEGYPWYERQVKKIAIEMALQSPNLISLEARIVPKSTEIELLHQQELYTKDLFKCEKDRCKGCQYYNDLLETCDKAKCDKIFNRLYFVYHFVKSPEKVDHIKTEGVGIEDIKCRHYELRMKNVWPTIANWCRLRAEEVLFDNVYGLDACNREIGCRPEVFAPYFRYARMQDTHINYNVLKQCKTPKLRITYHVGEDFLDVLDGLRAIAEAVTFMELRSGDRLGHALALGVNVYEWYKLKGMRVYVDNQDKLDNIAFLYDMIMRYQLKYPILQQNLRADFAKTFKEIYTGIENITIEDYILSMKLRGDEPGLYISGNSGGHVLIEDEWKRVNNECINGARENPNAVYLVHQYHYNGKSKYRGHKSVEVLISEDYVKAVADVQKILLNWIEQIGLGIECNPSSNVLIGTTKEYCEHPILRFNHYALRALEEQEDNELFVSINTDDLGVFDTNLENEYALMVCALQKVKNENGNNKFKNEEIYRWIDNVRRMGLEQSFKLSNEYGGKNV